MAPPHEPRPEREASSSEADPPGRAGHQEHRTQAAPSKLDRARATGLAYVSLYPQDYAAAVAFYRDVLGEPDQTEATHPEDGVLSAWRMGGTYLTIFPHEGAPRPGVPAANVEFAIVLDAPEAVDAWHAAFLAAGARECTAPVDTRMYEPMRFSCLDDPFRVRIDLCCPRG